MDHTLLFATTFFAFIMSVTPGPNNMMLLASGAQFGYLRTLPHIFGIIIGVALLLSSVLMGFGLLFELYPVLYKFLKLAGGSYLLYLAWKIARSPTDENSFLHTKERRKTEPMKLFPASLFQFVNPKAWAMAIGSVSTFTLSGELYLTSGLWIISSFAVMGFIAISIWACLGAAIGKVLTTPIRRRNFNWFMGSMTAATLVFIL